MLAYSSRMFNRCTRSACLQLKLIEVLAYPSYIGNANNFINGKLVQVARAVILHFEVSNFTEVVHATVLCAKVVKNS